MPNFLSLVYIVKILTVYWEIVLILGCIAISISSMPTEALNVEVLKEVPKVLVKMGLQRSPGIQEIIDVTLMH